LWTLGTAGAVSLLLLVAAIVGGCGGTAWRTITDPHGFAVELPRGWVAGVEDSGFVLCQPDPATQPGEVGPRVFFWPIRTTPTAKAEDLLAGTWASVFGDWPRGSTR